jgi:hypothetical protein
MHTIWKYALDPTTTLALPCDAAILTVQIQHGQPYIWIRLNTEHPTILRTFECFGTGHPLPNILRTYIGSFQMEGGNLMFHVFETTPAET